MAVAAGALMGAGGIIGPIVEATTNQTPSAGHGIVTSLNLINDPLNVALAFDALVGLGNLDGAREILSRQSPLNEFIEKVNALPNMTGYDKKNAITVATRMWESGQNWNAQGDQQERTWEHRAFTAAVGAAGISSELLGKLNPQYRQTFQSQIDSKIKQAEATNTFAARMSAQSQANKLIMDNADPSNNIQALTESAMSALERNRDEQAQKQIDAVLARANTQGFNPAGLLAEIEKERLRQAYQSPVEADAFANQISINRDANRDRDLASLLGFLGFGTTNAQNSANVVNAAAIGSAGIAASQLSAAGAGGAPAVSNQGYVNAANGIGSWMTTGGLLAGSGFFNSDKAGTGGPPSSIGTSNTNDSLFDSWMNG